MIDVIDAPVPYLIGIHPDMLAQSDSQFEDVIRVDLDTDLASSLNECQLPKRELDKLR